MNINHGTDIHFYLDNTNNLRPITGEFQPITDNNMHLIGILVNDQVCPVFDRFEKMVMVRLEDNTNLPMLPNMARRYGFPVLRHHMYLNTQHFAVANGRRRRN